jgi:integrase/recombinase XerD
VSVSGVEEPKWLRYKRWLEAMGALRPATIASHVSIAKNFEETVNDFSEDGIVRFMSKVSPNSKGQYRAALINFLTYLGRDDLAKYLKMTKSRIGKKYVDWYWTEEEVQKLIEACGDNLRHRIIVKLAYYLALRRREISELKVRDIDFKNMTVRVTLAKKAGTVYMQKPLYKDLADDIKQYIEETGKKPDDRLIDMHPVAVSYAVYHLSKKAGIRPAHIHKLRHSRIAHLRLKGVPLDVLSKFLGHEKLDTTMIYAHIGPPVIQKEIPPPFT